jgi:ABC-type transport system substrate-binding protein
MVNPLRFRPVAKPAVFAGMLAIGVVACGGSTSGGSARSTNLFDPSQFNEASVPWLAANVNATGSPPRIPTGTLRIAGSTDFSYGLDANGEYETYGTEFVNLFARQLVAYPPSTDLTKSVSVVPDAASSMPTVSADGKTYTFHVRSGIMWNTTPPRQVTSEDFERGLMRECDPTIGPGANPGYYESEIAGFQSFCSGLLALTPSSTASQRAAYINSHQITGIQTPDNSTIVFTLRSPSVDFLNILAMNFASAAPAEDLAFVPETPGDPLFSDGPYMVQGCNGTSTAAGYNDCPGYNVGHSVTFVPNPEWKQSTDPLRHQYVAEIDLKLDLSGSAAENEVQQDIVAGTTDLSFNTDVPTSDLAALQNHSDPRFGSFPSPGTTNPYLVFNLHSSNNNGALKNLKVRQALEYAIDKVALTKIYGGPNFNQPLNQVIAPGAQGYVQFDDYPTPNNQGNPSKCESLLKAAGYAPGTITLKDYYRDSGKHPAVFQEVQADFKKCGVTVVGTPISTGYYGSKGIGLSASTPQAGDAELAQGAWDITEPGWVPDWYGPTNGRATLPDLFDGSLSFPGTDWGGYDDPKVDNLVTQAESSSNLQQADSLWHQADEQIMADAPFIPFMTQLTNLMRSTRVHNAIWSPFSASYDLDQIWVS